MVLVIDYGMGNIFSVENALRHLGADVLVSCKQEDIKNAERIILPGVGSFSDGMKNLKNLGLVEVLEEEVLENKKPFLGICLGMQLLASDGEENGPTAGLGWISGSVRKLAAGEAKCRIPHMGWNDVAANPGEILFDGIQNLIFYFVHSYHFVPENSAHAIASCDYGEKFAAAVKKDNIFGTQFHPEKSQKNGLRLLENFLSFKP